MADEHSMFKEALHDKFKIHLKMFYIQPHRRKANNVNIVFLLVMHFYFLAFFSFLFLFKSKRNKSF